MRGAALASLSLLSCAQLLGLGDYSDETHVATGGAAGNATAMGGEAGMSGSPQSRVLWVRSYGSTEDEQAVDVVVANDDQIVVTGWVGRVEFDLCTPAGDVFVARLDATGAVEQNVCGIGTNGFARPSSIELGTNLLVSGSYRGGFDLAGAAFAGPRTPDQNGWVAELDLNTLAGSGLLDIAGIGDLSTLRALPREQDLLVTGVFTGPVELSTRVTLTPPDIEADSFGAHYVGGALDWHQPVGGLDRQQVNSLALLPNDRAVMGGFFRGSLAAEDGCGGVTINTLQDGFIRWVDSLGDCTAQVRFHGANTQNVAVVVPRRDGSVVAAGSFREQLRVGEGGRPIEAGGSLDAFVAIFDEGGMPMQTRISLAVGDEDILDARVLDDGRIVLVGTITGDLGFDTDAEAGSGKDGFVMLLSADLMSVDWWEILSGSGDDTLLAAAVSPSESTLIVVGSIGSDAVFGTKSVRHVGGVDAVVAALSLP